MANANRPRGFWPKGTPRRINEYQSGGAVYPGDFVSLNSAGQVVATAAGGQILGACLSYASASGQTVLVCDDPEQLYIGQAHGSSVAAQTNLNNVADILATSGDTTYKMSRMEIDDTTLSAAGSAQLLILGVENRPDNAFGANVACIVKVNESQLADSFAGV